MAPNQREIAPRPEPNVPGDTVNWNYRCQNRQPAYPRYGVSSYLREKAFESLVKAFRNAKYVFFEVVLMVKSLLLRFAFHQSMHKEYFNGKTKIWALNKKIYIL